MRKTKVDFEARTVSVCECIVMQSMPFNYIHVHIGEVIITNPRPRFKNNTGRD